MGDSHSTRLRFFMMLLMIISLVLPLASAMDYRLKCSCGANHQGNENLKPNNASGLVPLVEELIQCCTGTTQCSPEELSPRIFGRSDEHENIMFCFYIDSCVSDGPNDEKCHVINSAMFTKMENRTQPESRVINRTCGFRKSRPLYHISNVQGDVSKYKCLKFRNEAEASGLCLLPNCNEFTVLIQRGCYCGQDNRKCICYDWYDLEDSEHKVNTKAIFFTFVEKYTVHRGKSSFLNIFLPCAGVAVGLIVLVVVYVWCERRKQSPSSSRETHDASFKSTCSTVENAKISKDMPPSYDQVAKDTARW